MIDIENNIAVIEDDVFYHGAKIKKNSNIEMSKGRRVEMSKCRIVEMSKGRIVEK